MFKALQGVHQGMTLLYCIQALSTFSYAVLYSSLSLYITKQLGFSDLICNSIVGLFLGFNYILHLLGGFIGGRYLSNRCLFLITTVIQTIGISFLASANQAYFFIGLSLFLIGCGLNSTCYNNILTERFQGEDNQRDKAFFLSYAAMNIGFFAGYIISGFYDYSNQYQQLFYIAITTNVLTLIFIGFSWAQIADKNTLLSAQKDPLQRYLKNSLGMVITLTLLPFLITCFNSSDFSNSLVVVISIIMLIIILILGQQQKIKENKQKIHAYLILTVSSILFWMIYYTGPMGVTLFIKNNVNRHLFGYELATQWILNINAIVIIIGAPLMSSLLMKLRSAKFTVSVTNQFIWSFIILSFSFFALAFSIKYANNQGYADINWIILHYITQALSELLIGPIGYAMIGKIVPIKLQGLLMGTWMMVSGVASSLSHYFSNLMVKTSSIDPLVTNSDYFSVFNQLGSWALLGAVCLYFISRKIKKFLDKPNKNVEFKAIALT
ncbi:peptide MFS transporter [Legionella sp. D16C41]|uniref:peptide MFS transporter n=1 Tax=Legionella sp. D16C41 TaxID=3402688 RepID=UPI003AF84634